MFNYGLLVTARRESNTDRANFAKLLGISYSHLRKIENGEREPSLDVLRKISEYTGISAGEFLKNCDDECLSENAANPEKINDILTLIRMVDKEKFYRKNAEERISELEKAQRHILALIKLQERYIGILKQRLPAAEEAKKTAILAREFAKAGELCFEEIQAGLHLTRGTLESYLKAVKMTYSCKMYPEKTVEASTPGEAGMSLICFDCEAQAKELCRGYGGLKYPENFLTLIQICEANGIHNREKQAQILRSSFDKDISAHKLSEMISRSRHGKRVPDDLFYLKGAGVK
jgi:transcriptional regulator with XRE-family HTH domain